MVLRHRAHSAIADEHVIDEFIVVGRARADVLVARPRPLEEH